MLAPILSPKNNFSSALILDTCLKDKNNETSKAVGKYLMEIAKTAELIKFFENEEYPADTDTNSIIYSALFELNLISKEKIEKIIGIIKNYNNENDLIQTWLSKERNNRLDHVVATNGVYLFHLLDRGDEVKATEKWITEILEKDLYLNGSRYYHSPLFFLYFFNRLISKFPELDRKYSKLLKEKFQNNSDISDYPLDIAIQIILAKKFELPYKEYEKKLLNMQNKDGSFKNDALFHY
jgi:hypothetical protein